TYFILALGRGLQLYTFNFAEYVYSKKFHTLVSVTKNSAHRRCSVEWFHTLFRAALFPWWSKHACWKMRNTSFCT
uniref:Uncharacterized protein n=1 Tax=Aegilops tauschii subsp. strangulata TaxID=200361 RepID=A0A453P9W1_AEGTS